MVPIVQCVFPVCSMQSVHTVQYITLSPLAHTPLNEPQNAYFIWVVGRYPPVLRTETAVSVLSAYSTCSICMTQLLCVIIYNLQNTVIWNEAL